MRYEVHIDIGPIFVDVDDTKEATHEGIKVFKEIINSNNGDIYSYVHFVQVDDQL